MALVPSRMAQTCTPRAYCALLSLDLERAVMDLQVRVWLDHSAAARSRQGTVQFMPTGKLQVTLLGMSQMERTGKVHNHLVGGVERCPRQGCLGNSRWRKCPLHPLVLEFTSFLRRHIMETSSRYETASCSRVLEFGASYRVCAHITRQPRLMVTSPMQK